MISVDNDPDFAAYATGVFADDRRATIVCADGADWIATYDGPKFDLIFADTWPGKYNHLEETLQLLPVGGMYVIDDMLPQENWPVGHAEKASALRQYLNNRPDLHVCPMDWSTRVVIAVRIS